MSNIINMFIGLPIGLRAAIVLLLIVIIWGIIGKKILFVCSLFPFLINKIFRGIYLLIEMPIAAIHKKVGGVFYEIDNQLSKIGNKIDDKTNRWYVSWHSSQSSHLGKALLIYVGLIIFIALPSFIRIESTLLMMGQNIYLKGEDIGIEWLKSHELYNAYETVNSNLVETIEDKNSEMEITNESMEEILVVSGVNTSLLVRDVPSIQNGNKLASLHNGDEVTWEGQLTFSEVDGRVESWVKIITSDGVEGWSRFSYLHPIQYEDIEYTVTR